MYSFLKKSSGIAAIVVILILVVAVAAGGATVLAVRMVVTGEDYLAPFEELGWISSDNEDKKSSSKDEEEKKITTLADTSRLSSKARSSDAVQYYGSVTSAEMMGYDRTGEYYDLYNSMEFEINLFAVDNKVVELVFHMDIAKCLKVMYEKYGDELSEQGYEYDTYQEFEDEWLPYFETMIKSLFDVDEEMEQYVTMYIENGIIEMYVTEEGFDSLYEEQNIDSDGDNVDQFIDAIEDEFGITLKKV